MAAKLPAQPLKFGPGLATAWGKRPVMGQHHVCCDHADAKTVSKPGSRCLAILVPGKPGSDSSLRKANVRGRSSMRLGVKTKKPHVVGNHNCRLGRQQAAAMRLCILYPRPARLVRTRIAVMLPQHDDGRVMMADLARRRVNRILQVGHDLIDTGGQGLCLAGVDHFGKILNLWIDDRRIKPAPLGDRPDPHHRGIIEIAK